MFVCVWACVRVCVCAWVRLCARLRVRMFSFVCAFVRWPCTAAAHPSPPLLSPPPRPSHLPPLVAAAVSVAAASTAVLAVVFCVSSASFFLSPFCSSLFFFFFFLVFFFPLLFLSCPFFALLVLLSVSFSLVLFLFFSIFFLVLSFLFSPLWFFFFFARARAIAVRIQTVSPPQSKHLASEPKREAGKTLSLSPSLSLSLSLLAQWHCFRSWCERHRNKGKGRRLFTVAFVVRARSPSPFSLSSPSVAVLLCWVAASCPLLSVYVNFRGRLVLLRVCKRACVYVCVRVSVRVGVRMSEYMRVVSLFARVFRGFCPVTTMVRNCSVTCHVISCMQMRAPDLADSL